MNFKCLQIFSPSCDKDKYHNYRYMKMRERLSYLPNITAQRIRINRVVQGLSKIKFLSQGTRKKKKGIVQKRNSKMQAYSDSLLYIPLTSPLHHQPPWQYHRNFHLSYEILSPGSHEEINWGFALNLWQCISV